MKTEVYTANSNPVIDTNTCSATIPIATGYGALFISKMSTVIPSTIPIEEVE